MRIRAWTMMLTVGLFGCGKGEKAIEQGKNPEVMNVNETPGTTTGNVNQELVDEQRAITTVEKLGGKMLKGETFFSVNLIDAQPTDADLSELSHLKGVTHLLFDNASLNDAGLKKILQYNNLTSLNLLHLWGTKVTDASLKHLAPLTKLFYLDLGSTEVTDAGLKELTPLSDLTILVLRQTKVTDSGLKELAQLKKLYNLDLIGTQVTDVGLKELARFKGLGSLHLAGPKVTDTGVASLQKALPKCSISREYTTGTKH